MRSLPTTTMVAFALLALLGCAALVPPPAAAMPRGEWVLQRWTVGHHRAAGELGWWTRKHPAAARSLFLWEGTHRNGARTVVSWAFAHPHRGVDAFVARHRRWVRFDGLLMRHRRAADGFLVWSRRHPRPAAALMNHSGALRWAGRYPARAYRVLERPVL